MFGEKIPRSEIVYIAQLFLCLALIITFVVMLALHNPNRKYWVVMLSSLVGFIMPSIMSQNEVEGKPQCQAPPILRLEKQDFRWTSRGESS